MEISYNRLFKLLIDKGMKKTEFAKIAGLTPGKQNFQRIKQFQWIL